MRYFLIKHGCKNPLHGQHSGRGNPAGNQEGHNGRSNHSKRLPICKRYLRPGGRRRRPRDRAGRPDPRVDAQLAGGRPDRLRRHRRADRRHRGDGQLSRARRHAGRAARGHRRGAAPHPREGEAQPACLPRRARRQKARPRRLHGGAVRGLALVGRGARARLRLQPHLLLPPEDGRQPLADERRPGRPGILDRARQALPGDRRGIRPQARADLRGQLLDAGRLQGSPGRHQAAAGADGLRARRDL